MSKIQVGVIKAKNIGLQLRLKTRTKIKVIPQKLNLQMNLFEIFPESSLGSTVSKKNNKNDRSPFSLKRYDGPILPDLCLY